MSDRLAPARWFPAGVDGLVVDWAELADGTRLRLVRSAGGEGPLLVFVHGWGCSAFTWRHVLPRAIAAGHRCVAIDLPGHGLSDKPDDTARFTLPAMVAAVRDLLRREDWRDVVLIGHSMGGAISRDVACAEPNRVAALAMLAPAGFGRIRRLATGRLFSPDWAVPLLGPTVVPRWAVRRSMERTYGARAGFTEAEVDEYWAPTQFAGFVKASRHLLHHFAWDAPPIERLAPLAAMPELVLLGSLDRVVVSRDVERYFAQHAAALPRAEVRWLEGAGHALQEDAPAATWQAVLRWCRGLTSPGEAPPQGQRLRS
ncbi:MAG: alpha/beta fold hydrolase [Gemmatimonadaceae bacterium]|jgi:pimeloyl-ACP methyl ester carboxylesterase|nr:alpha/beta fold hydrolase [Gemmatimonadaceae bacterium]